MCEPVSLRDGWDCSQTHRLSTHDTGCPAGSEGPGSCSWEVTSTGKAGRLLRAFGKSMDFALRGKMIFKVRKCSGGWPADRWPIPLRGEGPSSETTHGGQKGLRLPGRGEGSLWARDAGSGLCPNTNLIRKFGRSQNY